MDSFQEMERVSVGKVRECVSVSMRVKQRTITYFVRGSMNVQLTSCLTFLDLAEQVNQCLIQRKQSV